MHRLLCRSMVPLCAVALLGTMAACSWTSERDLLRGADRKTDASGMARDRLARILEAEFGAPPEVVSEGSGEKAHPGGLYTFKVEALERDGSVAQEERALVLWPEVPVDAPAGAGLSAMSRGPGWQLLTSCGHIGLPQVYLEDMRVGEVRLFPHWGTVSLGSLNDREAKTIRQLERHPPGGPFITENPDVRVTLVAFCVPKVVRVTTRSYQVPGGSTLYEYTAIKTCP
jgi:hypothetical protein